MRSDRGASSGIKAVGGTYTSKGQAYYLYLNRIDFDLILSFLFISYDQALLLPVIMQEHI